MRMRNLLVWIAVGLIGLALAAGVTYAATQLSSQRIGLSAEPPSAGEELAPNVHSTRAGAPSRTTTTTEPAASGRDDDGDRDRSRDGEEHREGASGGGSDWDD